MPVYDEEILRVTINATLADGTKVMNRKTFKADFDAQQTATAVLNAVDTWVETLYAYVASQIVSGIDLEPGTVDVIEFNDVDDIWEVVRNIGTYDPLDTFANASEQLPNQCTAFVIGNTVRPKSKGRLFVFPFGEDTQDSGVLNAGAITALANLAAGYIADQTIGAGNVLLSGIVREAFADWFEFQSAQSGDIIGTQRRRRFGIGE
jgi:hypothetical protein